MPNHYIVLAFLSTVPLALFIWAARARRKEAAAMTNPPFTQVLEISEAPESTPPISDGVRSVARGTTPREVRQEEMRLRRATGLCLYCEKRANSQTPHLTLIRSPFDPIYRYLNVVPVNRWKIDVALVSESSPDLCETHAAIARSHLERRIAENQVDYASFVERQRNEMYEFERYALDERMLDDANAAKRGKKQKKLADVMQLQRPMAAANSK
jgi:hypothetical protein